MVMMSASPLVSRYGELHRAELRAEVRRDRLAATCQPDRSAMRWITSRLRIAAMARIAVRVARTSPMPPASEMRDPLTRGAV
jgi:hypothetical protein